MTKQITEEKYKYHPTAEYKYFYYDGEGYGFLYFKTELERDDAVSDAIQDHLDDGWDESVENIVCGELTGQAVMVDRRGPIGEVDEDGCDEEGEYWSEFDYMCNYKIKPLGFVCPSTVEKAND